MDEGSTPARAVASKWEWYPVLFVGAYIINAWADADVPLGVLWRPLVIAAALSSMLLVLVGLVLPRQRFALALAMVLGIVCLTVEPAIGDLLNRLEPRAIPALATLLMATTALGVSIGWRLWRRPGAPIRASRALTTVGITLLAVIIVTVAIDGSLRTTWRDRVAASAPSAPARDIYVVLLDGYPRADALSAVYGLDNSPFLHELEARGFGVASSSSANYLFTQHTLLSMLNFAHIPDLLPELQSSGLSMADALRLAVSDNAAFRVLRAAGYRVVTVSGGYESVALDAADQALDTGQLSEFERHLLRRTHLIDVLAIAAPDWLPDQLRRRVRDTLRAVPTIARDESQQSRFVFAHVPSPHAPNLFKANGSPQEVKNLLTFHADSPQGTGLSAEEYAAQVRAQVTYLNSLVIEMVDDLMAATSGEAVIVLMSDHGLRMTVTFGDPHDPNLWERYATLFAAYTPGHAGLFGDSLTNVNVLPILLNAYARADLECLPDLAYANGPGGYLDLHRVPAYDGASPASCGLRSSSTGQDVLAGRDAPPAP